MQGKHSNTAWLIAKLASHHVPGVHVAVSPDGGGGLPGALRGALLEQRGQRGRSGQDWLQVTLYMTETAVY